MRRSSIITIVLLVLVIIGLTVALVMTNLPKEKVENDPGVEIVDNQEDNISEIPKEVALDSDVAVRIDDIISIWFPKDCFHMIRGKSISKEDFSDADKLAIAYRYKYGHTRAEYISKSEMNQLVKDIFGSDDYVPQEFFLGIGSYEYNESEEKFVPTIGWGGGGPASHPARGIYKIDEYNDRYEVYEKYLYIENTTTNFSEKETIWNVRDCNLFGGKVLASYVLGDDTNYNSIQNETQGVVAKNFTKSKNGVNGYEDEMKILTKFYDQASEYKHTFMKNEDGSYYWLKSEIIK